MNAPHANARPVPDGDSEKPIAAAFALPTGYTLREFSIADYDQAIALWRSCEGIGLNDSDTRDAINGFVARNTGLSFVIEHTGTERTIVGTLLCGHDGRRGCLYHLAVAASHRRRGLSRALVDTCLSRLRRLGIVKCNLFLIATNHPGRAFWLKHGWSAREDLVVIQQVLLP